METWQNLRIREGRAAPASAGKSLQENQLVGRWFRLLQNGHIEAVCQ